LNQRPQSAENRDSRRHCEQQRAQLGDADAINLWAKTTRSLKSTPPASLFVV
jgi:hypothetical protein